METNSEQKSMDEIVASLEVDNRRYRRGEVDAILAQKNDAIPLLLEHLQRVHADPVAYVENNSGIGFSYVMILLGHFQETRAHQLLIDLCLLQNEIVDDLFGEMLFEDLPSILMRTSGGSMEVLCSLAGSHTACQNSRTIAVRALAFGVADGMYEREAVLHFFSGLLKENDESNDPDFASELVFSMSDLCPVEAMPEIEAAYKEGKIQSGIISLEDVQKDVTSGKSICIDRLRENLKKHCPDDVHKRMQWWACFEENADRWKSLFSLASGNVTTPRAPRPVKSKRKAAKAARKKNRKKR